MKYQLVQLAMLISVGIAGANSLKLTRRERRSALSLPSGSSVSVTMDLIIPVIPLLNTTLTYLWFDFPLTFDVPTADNLNELYISLGWLQNTTTEDEQRGFDHKYHSYFEEQKENHDRRKVYQYVEGFFENFGLDGPTCLKRTICELAEIPLSSHGLFGKILQLFFLPTISEIEPQVEEKLAKLTNLPTELEFMTVLKEDDYTKAYLKGKKSGGCPTHFDACPFSIFKILDF